MDAGAFSIAVDLRPIEALAGELVRPDTDILSRAITDAAEYVRQTWMRAVSGEMLPGMSKPVNNDKYYEGLETGESIRLITPLHSAVVCLYEGADQIEEGFPTYDMKPGLLNGPSARIGKHGKYNVIPFRHMTPTSSKGAAGKRAHGATMPALVYKVVKKQGSFEDPGRANLGQQIGQRTKLANAINLEAIARNMPAVMPTNYTWKYGMYHGMKKIMKTYEKTTQSTYLTFRAVSERSDPSSWIHPGQAANPVIAAVIAASSEQVGQIIMAGARAAWGIEA